MAKREKFGKFVLLEELDSSGLGTEYRAAKLGSAGLEKIVDVLRVKPAFSTSAEAVKALMDQVKFAAQLQSPNILKIYGIGKVDQTYYISYELIEGKSLKGIFARCRQDGFPLSVDHALLIASKVCSAMEYAHGRKTEAAHRYFHGMLNPSNVIVSYEGEVRVRGFGYWPARVREAGGMTDEEALYLAPEQAAGGVGDVRSDTFAVGAMLFEMLTGQRLFEAGRTSEVAQRLKEGRLQNPTGEDDALPKPILDILHRSLAVDPASRYAEIQEVRKGVDTLLFSGDFTPTTFNLAFFMHSLFREDIERESKSLKEEREVSYLDYLAEEVARPSPKTSPGMAAHAAPETPAVQSAARGAVEPEARVAHADETPTPVPAVVGGAHAEHATVVHAPAAPPAVHAPTHAPSHAPTHAPSHAPSHAPVAHPPAHAPAGHSSGHAAPSHAPAHAPAAHASAHSAEPTTLSAREAAANFTFHKETGPKSKTPMFAGVAVLLLAAAGGTWFALKSRQPSVPEAPPVTTLSAEAVTAMARVKELEEKLAAIEAEKAAAAAKAEEDAKKKIEAAAAARGQAADPAVIARAQEEARRKSQIEQERKAAEEQRLLEEERLAAEAALAEEKRKAEEAARLAAAATTLPATTTPPTTQAPSVKPGQLVDLNEPGVIAPIALSKPALNYPPIALRQRVDGRVDMSVLVDEKGSVIDAKVTTAAGGRAGLNEAAMDNARRWKFRPASKEGVPVKTWMPVTINFVLPR